MSAKNVIAGAMLFGLKSRGPHTLNAIYEAVAPVWPYSVNALESLTRATLQRNSSDSTQFNGVSDIFKSHGKGKWSLRSDYVRQVNRVAK